MGSTRTDCRLLVRLCHVARNIGCGDGIVGNFSAYVPRGQVGANEFRHSHQRHSCFVGAFPALAQYPDYERQRAGHANAESSASAAGSGSQGSPGGKCDSHPGEAAGRKEDCTKSPTETAKICTAAEATASSDVWRSCTVEHSHVNAGRRKQKRRGTEWRFRFAIRMVCRSDSADGGAELVQPTGRS